jgi:hypothetical protein
MKLSTTTILLLLACILALVAANYDEARDLVKERLNRRLERNRGYGGEDDEVGAY